MLTERSCSNLCLSKRRTIYNSRTGKIRQAPFYNTCYYLAKSNIHKKKAGFVQRGPKPTFLLFPVFPIFIYLLIYIYIYVCVYLYIYRYIYIYTYMYYNLLWFTLSITKGNYIAAIFIIFKQYTQTGTHSQQFNISLSAVSCTVLKPSKEVPELEMAGFGSMVVQLSQPNRLWAGYRGS